MFVLSDCVMPHTEVRTRAQASHGNITVLSHLNPRHTAHNKWLIDSMGILARLHLAKYKPWFDQIASQICC